MIKIGFPIDILQLLNRPLPALKKDLVHLLHEVFKDRILRGPDNGLMKFDFVFDIRFLILQ